MDWAIVLVLYTVSAFGFAYAAGHAIVSRSFREWLFSLNFGTPPAERYPLRWFIELIECPACFGFWLGLVCGWFQSRDADVALIAALFTMGSNFLLGRATGLIARPGDR